MVRSRRLELPRAFAHNDLNVARLPVPPRPHVISTGENRRWLAGASTKHRVRGLATDCFFARSQPAKSPFGRSEEHTSELKSLMRLSYAVCCLYNNKENTIIKITT